MNRRIKTALSRISPDVMKRYNLNAEINNKCFTVFGIDNKCYVNIDYNDDFEVEETEMTFAVKNKKVVVSFWKAVDTMHVTVL